MSNITMHNMTNDMMAMDSTKLAISVSTSRHFPSRTILFPAHFILKTFPLKNEKSGLKIIYISINLIIKYSYV